MANIGQYANPTWSNTPAGPGETDKLNATNMQAITDHIDVIDLEISKPQRINFHDLKKICYTKNTKDLHTFTAASDWAATGSATLADNTTASITGSNCVRLYHNSASAGSSGMTDGFTDIDLTKFRDGTVSTTSDFICFLFFLNDVTKINTDIDVYIKDVTAGKQHVCSFSAGNGLVTGFNLFKIKKSSFTSSVGAVWSAIDQLEVYMDVVAGASGTYTYWNKVWLERADPSDTSTSKGMQINSVNMLTDQGVGLIDYDLNVTKITYNVAYMSAAKINALHTLELYSDFYIKWRGYVKRDDHSALLSWYIDSNNYIALWASASTTLTLRVREGGANTDYTITISATVRHSEYSMTLSKKGTQVFGIFEPISSPLTNIRALAATTALTGEGTVGLGVNASNDIYATRELYIGRGPNPTMDMDSNI
jgi:hypothetical protein